MSTPNSSIWQSLFQGGEGVRLSVTTGTANVAVPGSSVVNQMMVTNLGDAIAFVKFGIDATLAASINCYPLSPGYDLTLPINPYIAAITESGTTTLLITTGNGTSDNGAPS